MYVYAHSRRNGFYTRNPKKGNDLLRLDNLHPQNGACRQKSTILNSVTKKRKKKRRRGQQEK